MAGCHAHASNQIWIEGAPQHAGASFNPPESAFLCSSAAGSFNFSLLLFPDVIVKSLPLGYNYNKEI